MRRGCGAGLQQHDDAVRLQVLKRILWRTAVLAPQDIWLRIDVFNVVAPFTRAQAQTLSLMHIHSGSARARQKLSGSKTEQGSHLRHYTYVDCINMGSRRSDRALRHDLFHRVVSLTSVLKALASLCKHNPLPLASGWTVPCRVCRANC